MENTQRIKTVFLKGKNKRIGIELNYKENEGFFYLIHTKSLKDFKTRNILKTTTIYSVETFNVIFSAGMSEFVNDDLLQNKILINEKTQQFKGKRFLNENFKRNNGK